MTKCLGGGSCVSCETEAGLKERKKAKKAAVLAYKNEEVVKRLKRELNIPLIEAQKLFQELLKFLWRCGTSRKSHRPPSKKVDEAWHTFIIFTRDYADFCQKHFGHFIHHQPDPEKESTSRVSHDGVACRTHGNLS